MVNISKHGLDTRFKNRLFRQFATFIGSIRDTNAAGVLTGLFSEKEHEMFAKRLAVVLMLQEGCSRRMIARTLSVSRTTVLAIERQYDAGRYDALIRAIRKASHGRDELWNALTDTLRLKKPARSVQRRAKRQ